MLALGVCMSSAQASDVVEEKLIAAYIINIIKFTSWEQTPPEVMLCLSDQTDVNRYMQELDGFLFDNDSTLSVITAPEDLSSCHVLFVDQDDNLSHLNTDIIDDMPHLLIISNQTDSTMDQVAIQFFVRNLKLRFFIDQDVVNQSQFKISSKLMRLSQKLE